MIPKVGRTSHRIQFHSLGSNPKFVTNPFSVGFFSFGKVILQIKNQNKNGTKKMFTEFLKSSHTKVENRISTLIIIYKDFEAF